MRKTAEERLEKIYYAWSFVTQHLVATIKIFFPVVFGLFPQSSLPAFDLVTPGKKLEFPRDAGAHPGHRIEWWYVTGHLDTKRGPMGFQVTFFRVRNPDAESNPSRFSPKQLLFAHAALADPAKGKLLSAQRSARMLEGVVEASTADTAISMDGWSLVREGGRYRARVRDDSFSLELDFTSTQPVLLQGEAGFSRKGPSSAQASYYYSEPHLRVAGRVASQGEWLDVTGTAWLDHEWSSELLAEEAQGWDWLGASLDGGAALMAFRIRGRDGKHLWASATYRTPDGVTQTFDAAQVTFTPRRLWKSPHTSASYPIAMELAVGPMKWTLEPLMDDQELDARSSTGTVYWEGAVRLDGAPAGRGYLELTGYSGRLRF
jgi:predicted secreted hydrolase